MATKKVAVYASLCARDEAAIKHQIDELVQKVRTEKGWSFNEVTDVYSDLGKSKTQIKGRTALEELIQKAKNGEYDLIVVRDVSRISRNGRLFGEIVSDLKECGVGFYCIHENIVTSNCDDYLRILFVTSRLCQNEIMGRMQSERIKFGIKMRKLRTGSK